MASGWRIPDPPADSIVTTPPALVASLQYLFRALRRGRRTWIGLGVVGFLLGLAYPMLAPPGSTATTTLMLAHESGSEPMSAMLTDVNILKTRTVAERVVEKLDLPISAEALQESIAAYPATSTVMQVTVPAADDADALALITTITDVFLDFRAEQLGAQARAQVEGNKDQIAALEREARTLDPDAAVERGVIGSRITELQQANADSELQTTTLLAASDVLDEPSIVPASLLRTRVMPAVTGIIGGVGLGMGVVLLLALISTRLRTREEVALAIGAPVRSSVGPLRPRGPVLGRRRVRAKAALEILSHGVESATQPAAGGGQVRVAVVGVENSRDVVLVVADVAARLTRQGRTVFAVDLSEDGRLAKRITAALAGDADRGGPTSAPVVFRPEGVAPLMRGPLARPSGRPTALDASDPRRGAWDSADVVLVLAEIDPAFGVDHLGTWADDMVLIVTSGRSTVERLRTTGELIRSSGLHLDNVLMVGADPMDESFGDPEADDGPSAEREVANR